MTIEIISAPLPDVGIVPREDVGGSRPFFYTTRASTCEVGFRHADVSGVSTVTLRIPARFGCDLGSCPRWSPYQPVRFVRAAVVHDFLYRLPVAGQRYWLANKAVSDLPLPQQKQLADCLLRFQVRQHCPTMSRLADSLIYTGVAWFGGSSFANKAALRWCQGKFTALAMHSDGVVGWHPTF